MERASERAHLSLRKSPKVNSHANQVVQPSIRALIQQQCRERGEGINDQPCLDATVDSRAGDEAQRPLPGQADEGEDHVDDLEDGHRLDGRVEILGEEVPEYLGPEEAFKGGGDLV